MLITTTFFSRECRFVFKLIRFFLKFFSNRIWNLFLCKLLNHLSELIECRVYYKSLHILNIHIPRNRDCFAGISQVPIIKYDKVFYIFLRNFAINLSFLILVHREREVARGNEMEIGEAKQSDTRSSIWSRRHWSSWLILSPLCCFCCCFYYCCCCYFSRW